VHDDLELQAAVVRGDHRVAEARGDRIVGPRQLVLEQEAGAGESAELLVVGEVQLDRAVERRAGLRERAQRAERKNNCQRLLSTKMISPRTTRSSPIAGKLKWANSCQTVVTGTCFSTHQSNSGIKSQNSRGHQADLDRVVGSADLGERPSGFPLEKRASDLAKKLFDCVANVFNLLGPQPGVTR
jgi:hypothetical protein